jgi:hypothetical protein
MPKQQQVEKVDERKISRAQAANRVVAELTGKTTLAELAKKADGLVVAGGGKSRLPASTHHVRRALETAEALGAVKLTRPTDVTVERLR